MCRAIGSQRDQRAGVSGRLRGDQLQVWALRAGTTDCALGAGSFELKNKEHCQSVRASQKGNVLSAAGLQDLAHMWVAEGACKFMIRDEALRVPSEQQIQFRLPTKLALTFCDPIELLIILPALSGSNLHLRHLPISISARPTACRYTCNAAAAACHACMLSGSLSCGPSARCGSSPWASCTHSSGNTCGSDGTAAERTKMTETAEEMLVSVRTHDEPSGRWTFCQSHAVACPADMRGEVSHMQSSILSRLQGPARTAQGSVLRSSRTFSAQTPPSCQTTSTCPSGTT